MTDFIHIVTEEESGYQLKDIMRKRFDFSSRLRNRIKRHKLVTVNGSVTEGWIKLQTGDEIKITLPEESSRFTPQPIPVFPVFEDDDLLVLNKQPGLIVHPTTGHPTGTLANALMYYMEKTGKQFKIRFINRLDMDTSGLILVAKNPYCQSDYSRQIKAHIVKKKYLAIVKGIVSSDSGTINLPIGRPDPDRVQRGVMEGGSPSITHYKVLKRYNNSEYTLVELLLETGRTHQIRVHMSHIGHPILGDRLYGGDNVLLIERQALHAAGLSFKHPITGQQLNLEAPVPKDMTLALSKLT